MAQIEVDYINRTFPIKNSDGTSFHGLSLRKATVEKIVMSLGDKISGDVYYKDTSLTFNMGEYVEYEGVKYELASPPTVVREGLVKDNSGLNGMTKYSLVFYHPMYKLANIPFTDVAVTEQDKKHLSQSKKFSWVGNLRDFIDKLNANLKDTEWLVGASMQLEEDVEKASITSEVLTFDNNYISDALKTAFDEWEIPFTILREDEEVGGVQKNFYIEFSTPSGEITGDNDESFIFRFGQGVGLKNESSTPKNNKIVTRIVGSGSDRNIPYGYPQVPWYGNPEWDYTVNNSPTAPNSYPIYKGIVNGTYIKLIKHPFTRTTLMPSVYDDCVFNKVSPYIGWNDETQTATPNQEYDADIEIIDYYDAINTPQSSPYPNPINPSSPSVEIHKFEDIYPRLADDKEIVTSYPINTNNKNGKIVETQLISSYIDVTLASALASSTNQNEKVAIQGLENFLNIINNNDVPYNTAYYDNATGGSYTYSCVVQRKGTGYEGIWVVEYTSDSFNSKAEIVDSLHAPSWDDTMDDNGEYVQSYFKMTLPALGFDLYACASITQNMQINMRSGACIGCTFNVVVDWDDYKKNFYDVDGNFDPVIGHGHPRRDEKYPDSTSTQIEIICQKDLETFGTLMPNTYKNPKNGDKFVILGISLPLSYIRNAEEELDDAMKEYMLENNVHYFDYPLKFDEYFLATHLDILEQISLGSIVRFMHEQNEMALFVKQISITYGDGVLPRWDITLTDDIEVVLSKIGQVTDDVSRMRVQLNDIQTFYSKNLLDAINSKLSRVSDDIALGRITFQNGLDALGRLLLSDEIKSSNFVRGLNGRGWRIDELGNAEVESLKVRSFLEVIELLINRVQAQEGDTIFTDNDQIDKVDEVTINGATSYILSLKEKYDGYITSQSLGNILKGRINTLAAKEAGVSDESAIAIEADGENSYYTSWMRVVGTNNTEPNVCGVNQIRVVLFGDNETPAGRNFEPCELMTIARWGNILNPDEEGITQGEKERRERLQRLFYLSNLDGRIVKLRGVNSPILRDTNYGTTLGVLPDFIINNPNSSIKSRLLPNKDYLYAQGIVVGDFIKVDINDNPLTTYVDCGEWVDGSTIQEPTVGHGIYLHDEKNDTTLQYETHDVWHNGFKWRCLQHQPVITQDVREYHEPTWQSVYWQPIEGDKNYTMDFVSSNGYSFRKGANWSTIVTPHIFYGGIDITSEATNTIGAKIQFTKWERTHEHPSEASNALDATWNEQHVNGYNGFDARALVISQSDTTPYWASNNKLIFTCFAQINDGDTIEIVENQIIA